jgi:hypothetical protein
MKQLQIPIINDSYSGTTMKEQAAKKKVTISKSS